MVARVWGVGLEDVPWVPVSLGVEYPTGGYRFGVLLRLIWHPSPLCFSEPYTLHPTPHTLNLPWSPIHGQCEMEVTATIERGVQPDLTVVSPDNPLAEGQANAIAILRLIAREPKLLFENGGLLFFRDAEAIITDADLYLLGRAMQDRQLDKAPVWGVFVGIV